MKQKNKRNIFDDKRVLGLAAALLAVLCWIIVAGFISPGGEWTIENVSINMTRNQSQYRGQNLIITKLPDNLYVDVKVTGNSSTLAGLKSTDILAYADFSNITNPGVQRVAVRVEPLGTAGFEIDQTAWGVAGTTQQYIEVEFDRVVTKTVKVEPQAAGIRNADGFYINSVSSTITEILLRGPEKELAKIDRAYAIVDEDYEADESQTFTNIPLVFRDEGGQDLTLSSSVELAADTTDVIVTILKSAELDFTVDFIGVASSSFDKDWLRSLMEISPASIRVGGTPAALESLGDTRIVGTIDVSELGEKNEFPFELTLPNNITAIDQLRNVMVTFNTEGLETKTFNEVTNIQVVNAPANLDIEPVEEMLRNVVMMGPQEEIQALLADNILVQIDASNVASSGGTQQTLAARVMVVRSGRVFAIGTYQVMCNVTVK